MNQRIHLWWMIRVYCMCSRNSVQVETLISQIHRIRKNPQWIIWHSWRWSANLVANFSSKTWTFIAILSNKNTLPQRAYTVCQQPILFHYVFLRNVWLLFGPWPQRTSAFALGYTKEGTGWSISSRSRDSITSERSKNLNTFLQGSFATLYSLSTYLIDFKSLHASFRILNITFVFFNDRLTGQTKTVNATLLLRIKNCKNKECKEKDLPLTSWLVWSKCFEYLHLKICSVRFQFSNSRTLFDIMRPIVIEKKPSEIPRRIQVRQRLCFRLFL